VLNFLQDNLVILTLLFLTVLVLGLLGLVMWAAVNPANDARQSTAPKPQRLSMDSLKLSFRRAVELIEANIAARSDRYSVPWVLVINEGQGDDLPLVQAGLQSALSTDATLTAAAQGITWNFFDKGITVQLQGSLLGSTEGDDPENRTWDEFLGLCRDYRSDRPFDSVVISLPATSLLRQDPQGLLDLAARAKAIHRRLWLAQNRLALRFPIYLVISGCEAIPGFSRFSAALPEAVRGSMLGWSCPYELAAPYQSSWTEAAVDSIVSSVFDACSELSALELPGADSTSYFLLPSQLETLRSGLRLFADDLMRPSAYHEPFLLRGMYLSGDCGESAILRAEATVQAELFGGLVAAASSASTPVTASTEVPEAAAADWTRQPAFLRDIFDKKIFAESGLVRPTSVQRLRRPALTRTAQWAAICILGVWGGGLIYSAVRIDRAVEDIATAIQRLDRDTRSGLSSDDPTGAAFVQARSRAIEALNLMSQVDSGALGTVFMPGSWSFFDTLQDQVQRRLELRFSEVSLGPITRGIYARVGELTGVPSDPETGYLIQGASCALPMGWAAQLEGKESSTIDVEDLPEFAALLLYMSRVEQMDKVLTARARLVDGTKELDSADLRLIVKTVLGAELAGNVDRTAILFRKFAKRQPSLPLDGMRQAAACSYGLALGAVHVRLFERNELLEIEKKLNQASRLALSGGAKTPETTQSLEAMRLLLDELKRQEFMMLPGKGAWIQRMPLQLGQAYDTVIQRAQGSLLIGSEPVETGKKLAAEGFARFKTEWDVTVTGGSELLAEGLFWSDKESKWSFSEDRQALRNGLTQLLAQRYMSAQARKALPKSDAQSWITWDKSKLDQALLVVESKRKFQSDILPNFPAAARSDIERVVNAVLADSAMELVSQAVVAIPRGAGVSAASDADRGRLTKVQAMLIEMGAKSAADELSALVSRDALSRLRQIDEAFLRSDLFQPRDADFKTWAGDRGPLLSAFGAGDSMALGHYVSEQQARVEALSREAEQLLVQVESALMNGPTARRWQEIAVDLNRYKSKSPNSNLLALEQFIMTVGTELDRANCAEKLPLKPVRRRGGDIFADRLYVMQVALAGRCRELRQLEVQEAWAQLAEGFNRDLAGRSPFAAIAMTGSAGAPQSSAVERPAVDVDELPTVLKAAERASKLLADKALDAAGKGGPNAATRRFSEQMDRVRAFMAPLFPTEENSAPGYDLVWEFRANTAAEQEGNKIIDWSVTVGSQTLRQRDPQRALRWEPGAPIVVSMRLARDGPAVPLADTNQSVMAVLDDRTVVYRFSDLWALNSMIARQREAETQQRNDVRSQLLRFEFPMALLSDNPKIPPTQSRAKVYLRVTVSAAGKRAPIAWPGVFPTKAPDWGTP